MSEICTAYKFIIKSSAKFKKDKSFLIERELVHNINIYLYRETRIDIPEYKVPTFYMVDPFTVFLKFLLRPISKYLQLLVTRIL